MKRVNSVLELIGATPIVRLSRVVEEESAEVWVKLESANPGGSVKDRIALAMVEAAETGGHLRPGGTIVEPTSGNTGIGLAMVAAVKGYRLIVTMFDTASAERRMQMQARQSRGGLGGTQAPFAPCRALVQLLAPFAAHSPRSMWLRRACSLCHGSSVRRLTE